MKKSFLFIHPSSFKQIAYLSLFAFSLSSYSHATTSQQQAVWYRYYDSRGIENISDKVTPEHIRHGYEALDRNRQVIRRNTPYNAEADQRNAAKHAQQIQQRNVNNTLKKAYSNSHVASQKQKDALEHIQKQIRFQREQLNILERDREIFKKQASEFTKKRQPIPSHLQKLLQNNQANIDAQKRYLESLQNSYQVTQNNYERIIKQLKALE